MAKKKETVIEEAPIKENISNESLEDVMSTRYATYARYVIQDRAIPDVRDGLKPVQRRIIYAMYNAKNTFDHPTKKCAHTVGEVMGKYHPHGDSSIYEALARMSQDWKVRVPLIDFQGNNGSIDGDSPAAYRYTESRLALISNELIRDLDKKTVDMQLTFDDTEFEPTVLPSRFPNLYVNGSEGIAVAMATEIPTHNLKEIIDATIYRINHKTATIDDLLEIMPGPDFPTGGIIYKSEGLKNIYYTGRGRIEIAAKAVIEDKGNIQQIVITEIPYKTVKINIVHEIDLIRHNKVIDGIVEVRDESDFQGIRIVVDLKKDAKADLILTYLFNKTSLKSSYSANVVAICNGRPRTLNLMDYIDSYIAHQVDVVTRKTRFDLEKSKARLHIVDGLIIAALNITRVVEIIRKSKDKANSKENLIQEFNLSMEQAEAIVTMPLYKISASDVKILQDEKLELEKNIEKYEGILSDEKKLNRVIIHDLTEIANRFGDDRRTQIIEKEEEKQVNKRDLIKDEECYIAITKDGYMKRSTVKSFMSSGEFCIPGVKTGDAIIAAGKANTTHNILAFTNLGNYITIPVYELTETKWKDEGEHISSLVNFGGGKERIIKAILVKKYREDIFAVLLTKNGQIKRTSIYEFQAIRKSKPVKCIKLLPSDELIDVKLSTGDANIMVFSNEGNAVKYNENELYPLSIHASGAKAMNGLSKQKAASLLIYQQEEKGKIVLITDSGCERIFNSDKIDVTPKLAKPFEVFKSFKSDSHKLVSAIKVGDDITDKMYLGMLDSNGDSFTYTLTDFYMTDITKMCRKNINELAARATIKSIYSLGIEVCDEKLKSQPIKVKEKPLVVEHDASLEEASEENEKDKGDNVEQISIFDDLND